MKILALDLAGKNTGWVVMCQGSITAEQPVLQKMGRMYRGSPELVTYGSFVVKERPHKNENWAPFNLRRFETFRDLVRGLISLTEPDRLAYEYQDHPREKWGPGDDGSAGREFNAMRGLARAEGWLQAVMSELSREGKQIGFSGVTARQAKWEIAHRATASKDDVRRYIALNHNVNVSKMTEDESDAYSIGLADWLVVLGLSTPVPERVRSPRIVVPRLKSRRRKT